MSKEHAERLIERLDKDKAFRQKTRAGIELALQIANDEGYNVSLKEVSDALKKKWGIRKHCWKGEPDFSCFSETPRL